MTTALDLPAKGKVIENRGETIVFQPAGTNYQLQLIVEGEAYDVPVDQPVECTIRVQARKVYSVPSGGNFIQPIFGPPRIIQGRVRWLDERHIVVQAGAPIVVQLPVEQDAMDLNRGPIAQGSLVNVVALPGATVRFK